MIDFAPARLWLLFIPLVSLSSIARSEIPVAIWDPEVLASLESAGLEINNMFPGRASTGKASDLIKNTAYADIVESLNRDLNAAQKSDPKLSVTMKTSHRLFNIKWLSSNSASFELAAVVNRLDRLPFHQNTCGELRLIYRLTYDVKEKGHVIHSRLPLTVNMVFHSAQDEDGHCAGSVNRWQTFVAGTDKGTVSKPSDMLSLSDATIKSIEINMQSVRWPSTTRGDLGAHAEYLLRVFTIKNGRAQLSPLENTPAWERLSKNPAQKKALLDWIKSNIEDINNGTAVAPEKFLTSKSTSFSPRGLTRIANRPWSAIFSVQNFKDIDFNKLSYLKSPEALLRRLDDSSCAGCHQNRPVAGFHILGVDRKGTSPHNAIAVPGSPHFMNDLPRRVQFFSAVASKKKPEGFRPLSERAQTESGVFGAHCGLGDPGFSAWTCETGLICRSFGLEVSDRTVGQCFSSASDAQIGEPCETGHMIPNLNPHKDRVKNNKDHACAHNGICESNFVGFPEGMCAQSCNSKSNQLACGSIAILAGFNDCLGKGLPFTKCLAENTRPAGLRACTPDMPCRDDYICSGLTGQTGTCIPPYFLFQMRVDGHPRPN